MEEIVYFTALDRPQPLEGKDQRMNSTVSTSNRLSQIRRLTAIAVFCAFAYIATLVFHFKVSFLTFDLKDAVMTIGAMQFGPLAGGAMVLVAALLELITISETGLYGFVMNILSSASLVCVSSLIYKYKRNMTGAVVGVGTGVVAMVAVMMGANLLITPFYMGVSTGEVAALIPTLLFPFNLVKGVFNGAVTFALYKPVITALRKTGFVSGGASGVPKGFNKRMVFVSSAAVVLAVLALAFFFVVLKGSFTFGMES